jgi:hypothetical protein
MHSSLTYSVNTQDRGFNSSQRIEELESALDLGGTSFLPALYTCARKLQPKKNILFQDKIIKTDLRKRGKSG